MLIQKIQNLFDFVFSFHELLRGFIRANKNEKLVNSLFGVNIFNLFPLFTSYSSLYSSDMVSASYNSADHG